MKFLSSIKAEKWVQTLTFIGTFVFGLLIGPLIENFTNPLLDNPEKIIISGIILVSFLVIVLINAILVYQSEAAKNQVNTREIIENLSHRFGLTVEFLSDKDENKDAYSVVRDLAETADHELLILDHRPSLTPDRYYDKTPPESLSRKLYYELLTKKALSKNKSGDYFRYKRIVQLDEGPTNTWDPTLNMDSLFKEHCQKIVQFRESTSKAVSSISTSRVFFPKSSIIISDARRVLIELAIVGPDGKTKVAGDLVFNDPEGKLARPLKQLFDHIESQSTLITKVIDSNLPLPSTKKKRGSS